MADYISREAAYKTLTEYYHHSSGVQHTVLRESLNRVPPADVRPVVMGKWMVDFADNGWIDHTCSVCGWAKNTDIHVRLGYNFCPNCGADMRPEGRAKE